MKWDLKRGVAVVSGVIHLAWLSVTVYLWTKYEGVRKLEAENAQLKRVNARLRSGLQNAMNEARSTRSSGHEAETKDDEA